jgi:hypothetical protein
MKINGIVALAILAPVTVAVVLNGRVAAQSDAAPVRFSAVAINMGSPGRAGASQVEIVVNRWSPNAERDRLLAVLFDKGPEKLLDTLVALPRVGYFRTPNSIGYDIHFAQRTRLPDRGERIVLATDRYISFWEARNQPRSYDYPFTVIELHFGPDGGKGEGKMSIATKIIGDRENQTIVLENYATQPIMLNEVTREKA